MTVREDQRTVPAGLSGRLSGRLSGELVDRVQASPDADPWTFEAYAAWGRALAELHRRDTTGAPLAPLPWILTDPLVIPLLVPTRSARNLPDRHALPDPHALHALVGRLLSDVPLLAAARRAAGRWVTGSWIHGNATPSNVIVTQSAGETQARLVDLTDAGLGDPAWDLATAVDAARRTAADPHKAAALMRPAYSRGGGPAVLHADTYATRRALTAFELAASASLSGGGLEAAHQAMDDACRIAADGM